MREITGAASVQGSQEWLDLRVGKFTASQCYTMTKGTPSAKRTLAEQLKGITKVEVNSYMERGTQYEEEARKAANKRFNTVFTPKVFVHGMFLASLDGHNDAGVHIEIKIPGHAGTELAIAATQGVIPEKYQYQMCMQAAVCSASESWFVVYLPETQELYCIKYTFDPVMWAEIQAGCPKFYEEYMGEDNERRDKEWQEAASRLIEISSLRKPLDDEEKSLKAKLVALANKQDASGCGVSVTQSITKGGYDYAQYCTDNVPEALLESYKKLDKAVSTVRISKSKE